MIALLKAIHIVALALWCAGLVLLPLLIQRYGRRAEIREQAGYAEFRWLTHRAYVGFVTPAAVVAVTAGTALVFALQVLDPWMLAKLVCVAGMVLVHAWLGHLIVQAGEGRGAYRLPPAGLALLAVVPLIGLVLWLVLAKPAPDALIALFPEALLAPRNQPLPGFLEPL